MFTVPQGVPPQVQEVPRSVSSLGSVGNTHPVYFWQKQTEAASRQSRKAGNKNSRCLLTNGRCSATTEGKWPNTVWGSQRIRQAWRSAFKKRSRWGVKLRVGQNKTASHTHTHTQGTWRHVQWDQGVSALVLTTQNISFKWNVSDKDDFLLHVWKDNSTQCLHPFLGTFSEFLRGLVILAWSHQSISPPAARGNITLIAFFFFICKIRQLHNLLMKIKLGPSILIIDTATVQSSSQDINVNQLQYDFCLAQHSNTNQLLSFDEFRNMFKIWCYFVGSYVGYEE